MIPVEPSHPVHTFWDLGWSDSTAIWFAQKVGFETRVVDYYQGSQQKLAHYLAVLSQKPYVCGDIWLPHDARAKSLGTGKSIEEQVRAANLGQVHIVPKLGLTDGLDAARTLLDTCWMDDNRCEAGIAALEHYRYEFSQDTGLYSSKPCHDWASHGADGFRYMAIAIGKAGVKREPLKLQQGKSLLNRIVRPAQALGWMAQ
jgi:phage terminase large subunit